MDRQTIGDARPGDGLGRWLSAGLVVATLATAAIHWTLGGPLFALNALGYATLALALVAPVATAQRFRWLVRVGLLAFTGATIGGWVLFGARYELAYLAKGIELGIVALLLVAMARLDGGPRGVLAHLRGLPGELRDLAPTGRRIR
jgi:hypothetical protein